MGNKKKLSMWTQAITLLTWIQPVLCSNLSCNTK